MKVGLLPLILAGAVPALLWGQTQHGQDSVETTEAKIIGEIPDGTLSEPAHPLARLLIAPEDVMETKTFDLGDRQIVTQKITPIELPPIPEPPPPPDPLDPAVQARMQALRKTYQATHFLMIGATVYRSAAFTNGPRTRITSWGGQGREQVVCWSSADWSLLAGTGGVVGESGQKFAFFMSSSSIDLDKWSAFVARRGRATYQAPEIPGIP